MVTIAKNQNAIDEAVQIKLCEEKAKAIARINDAIGNIRSTYVTVIPFQETTYSDKEKEAAAFVDDTEPDLVNYPYIASEIGISAPTAFEVAQLYLNLAHLLRVQNASLEQVRLGAIATIETATDITTIENALSAFMAAIEQFSSTVH